MESTEKLPRKDAAIETGIALLAAAFMGITALITWQALWAQRGQSWTPMTLWLTAQVGISVTAMIIGVVYALPALVVVLGWSAGYRSLLADWLQIALNEKPAKQRIVAWFGHLTCFVASIYGLFYASNGVWRGWFPPEQGTALLQFSAGIFATSTLWLAANVVRKFFGNN